MRNENREEVPAFRLSRAERRALLNPSSTRRQMSAIHINDRAPNFRYRGLLKIVFCHSCGNSVSELCNCPRCGFSEINALELTELEHRQFIQWLRKNPENNTSQAMDWVLEQRTAGKDFRSGRSARC